MYIVKQNKIFLNSCKAFASAAVAGKQFKGDDPTKWFPEDGVILKTLTKDYFLALKW